MLPHPPTCLPKYKGSKTGQCLQKNSSSLHEGDGALFGVCYCAQNILEAENNMYISFHYLVKVLPYIRIIAQLVSIFAWNIYAPYFICIPKEMV